MTQTNKLGNWLDNFDDRQQKEIGLAHEYVNNYNHGTTGHNALVIIAKMANLLAEQDSQLRGRPPSEPTASA